MIKGKLLDMEVSCAARELVASLPAVEKLNSLIAEWWLGYASQDRNLVEKECSFATLPLDGLLNVVLPMLTGEADFLREGFRRLAANPQGGGEAATMHASASILMGRAVADSLFDTEALWWDVGLAALVFEYNQAFFDAFEKRVAEHLEPDAPQREAYIRKFLYSDGWREERAMFSLDRRYFQTERRAWADEVNPYQVWRVVNWHSYILRESIYPVVLLLRADAPEWVQAFDALPLPSAKFSFFEFPDDFSFSRFHQLFETASPIFDDSGGWTKACGITVGLAGLYHIFQPPFAGKEKPSLEENKEILTGLVEVFRVLCSRGSWGVQVLLEFQKHLTQEFRRSLKQASEALQPFILKAATKALAGMEIDKRSVGWHGLLGDMLIEEVRNPGKLEETSAESQWQDFCVLCLPKGGEFSPDEELASWLGEYSSDWELGWLGQWAGRALAWSPRAATRWENSWRDLWLQREVAWHRYERDFCDPLLGSVALIEAGLGALLWEGSLISDKVSFWDRLVCGAVFLWHRRSLGVTERTILRCVAHAPFIFGDDLQKQVAYIIDCLGNQEPLLVKIAKTLCQNGIPLLKVTTWFKDRGVALLELVGDEINWQKLASSRSIEAEALSEFRDELSKSAG